MEKYRKTKKILWTKYGFMSWLCMGKVLAPLTMPRPKTIPLIK